MSDQRGRRLMWILWPAFLVAAAANALFFTAFDPHDLTLFGAPVEASREVMYTLGFFAFWAIAVASSALTCYLGGGRGSG
jgi:membrane protein DedA with SNARE-associated domain